MSNSYRIAAKIHWNWGNGTATGKVATRFERRVQCTLAGAKIVRNGTPDNPAYLIEQEDGTKVLKRGSELSAG